MCVRGLKLYEKGKSTGTTTSHAMCVRGLKLENENINKSIDYVARHVRAWIETQIRKYVDI